MKSWKKAVCLTTNRADDSPEMQYLHERRKALNGYLLVVNRITRLWKFLLWTRLKHN